MTIREQIMALTALNVSGDHRLISAANLAENRERELEETISIVAKDREQTIEICEKLLERQAAMIAELSKALDESMDLHALSAHIEATINKYEVQK